MNTDQIQHYLERLSHILRAEARMNGAELDLQPVHLEVLHYLKQCNHYSNTPQSVTLFLGLTKGTVSQSIKIHESKQLLTKSEDKQDKRIVHLHLTDKAFDLMKVSNPSSFIKGACSSLSLGDQHELITGLHKLVVAGQPYSKINSFGQCKGCGYNQKLKTGEFFCSLTQETLEDRQIQLICKDHKSAVDQSRQQVFDL